MLGVVGIGFGVVGQYFVGVFVGVGVFGELVVMLWCVLEEVFVVQEVVVVVGCQFQCKLVGGGEGVVVGFGFIVYVVFEGFDGVQYVDYGVGQFGLYQVQVDGDQWQQVFGQLGLVGYEDVGGGGKGGEVWFQFVDFGLLG